MKKMVWICVAAGVICWLGAGWRQQQQHKKYFYPKAQNDHMFVWWDH